MVKHLKPMSDDSRGQSLVETALVVPLLVMLVLNAVNFGYFFLITLNLTGAARTSTLYSIEGAATPVPGGSIASSGGSTPTTNKSSVTYLIYQDLTGALWNPTGVTVQVCSQANITSSGSGVNTANGALRTNCELCNSGGCGSPAANAAGFPVPAADPEAPIFVLNRVDIQYDFPTLIPGTIFNIPLRAAGMCNSGSCTIYRHAEMRAMN
jgi:hypothetical protein